MKNKYFLIFACLLMITLPVLGQNPKIDSIHDLFTDDIGERESLFYEALGSAGGVFACPAWSPDGRMVAFNFNYYPHADATNTLLCLFDLETKGMKIISNSNDVYPSWSPDSQQLVFNSDRTGASEIYKINLDGTNLIQLTNTGRAFNAAWSPDSSRIAYAREGQGLWVMNNDGSSPTQISAHPRDCGPSWAPDCLHLAFQSDRDGKLNIWIMNADGSNPVRITQKGGASPAWSPDGKWIAFERDEQIWLVSPDGQKEVHLKTDFPVGCPSWSPDSRKIVFDGVKDFEYDADLYVMTIKY